MRVLHVYAGNLYGGVEAMLATIARHRGAVPEMETRFALAYEGRLAGELRDAGAPVAILGGARISRSWTVWSARRAMGKAIMSEKPDISIFHSAWTHGIFAPAARRADVPAVFWLHDAVSGGAAERLARRTPPRLAICTSEFVRATLPKLFPHAEGEVVHPAVAALPDVAVDRVAVRAELGTEAESVVIVQASRMEPWKGHRVHLEALGLLRDDPRWTCWLAGGAQRPHELRHRDEMQALAARLGIAERVRWLGERRDVPRLLAAADVLCQPNLGPEPFGITFVEAMYAGLPVIGAALGGAREIVTDATGVLVPPDDPSATAEALRMLIGDAEMRARLGAAGPARARELCDPEMQMRKLHGILTAGAA
ncbi:glycosyltransferase [Longimicrobium sp.]|uniref:glycosyltransferase n=1 Tax=Longimicrobium sp. TaxID=2029185 RepID=UPI002B55E653|nr:glycosyltransferase [Longimicrobium sp.]HSU15204.1 glycosyltransferase [Longimicrobium sp.]